MKTKVAMLQNQHLEMGDHYVHKDHKDAVFRFMSIDPEKATFVSAPLFGPETTVTVELGMLKQWKAFKGELPVVGCAKLTTLFLPQYVKGIKDEPRRCHVYDCMVSAYLKNTVNSKWLAEPDLVFTQNPQALYFNKDFRKGQCQLWPVGQVGFPAEGFLPASQFLLVSKESGAVPKHFYVQPPRCQVDFVQGRTPETTILCPYFWVKPTGDHLLANMVIERILVDDWLEVPVFVNSVHVKKHSKALFLDKKRKASSE